MTDIIYLKGDATNPLFDGTKIIAHICNDTGGWGKGFVLAISKRWKEPDNKYRQWYRDKLLLSADIAIPFELGRTQFVMVQNEPVIYIANMIAQHGIGKKNNIPPIRYEALSECLQYVCTQAKITNASVHLPRIGCGLAGGKWEIIEPIIKKELLTHDIPVYVYDFE